MAGKNRKKPEKLRERAIQLYGVTGSITKVAKQLGVSKSTVHRWLHDDDAAPIVEQVRTEKKREFAQEAGEVLRKSLLLLDRRITTALEGEEELAALLREIRQDGAISPQVKESFCRKLQTLEVQRLGELATAMGVLYDKRALAQGEATENGQFEVKITVVDHVEDH